MKRDDDNDLSYGALMMLCEGHGTSEIYRRVYAALGAKDAIIAALTKQVEFWKKGYNEAQMMKRYFKPSVDAPMESAEDGDYVFFTDMQAALTAKDQQVQAWQMAYEGLQRQFDTLLAEAVWAMERMIKIMELAGYDERSDSMVRAHTFLARPDVQALEKGTPPCE